MKRSRGISLIEALVALAIMAFGLVGVVGMQATLRQSSDVSKQRSEAVRIAQETIEDRRAYSVLATQTGRKAFADIVTQAATTVSGTASNTTFTLAQTVQPLDGSQTKTLVVDVGWADRSGTAQSVRLSTSVTRVAPDLAGTLMLPPDAGAPVRSPRGRHAAIPPAAVDQGDGTSSFAPPGSSGVTWVFSNSSGFIVSTCVGSSCSAFDGRLLTGFIDFATGATQPTPAMAEAPPGPATLVEVSVAQTFPVTQSVDCFEALASDAVTYFCALPVDPGNGSKWAGRSELQITNLASSVSAADAARQRVCRYTPVRGSHPPVPSIKNEEHPLDYADVTVSLINQNFLVIRAGDGTTAFDCPADDTSTPFVNGNTWHHQPNS